MTEKAKEVNKEEKPKFNIYNMITDKIIVGLEQNKVPWKRKWDKNTQMPKSLITGKAYQGLNFILLSLLDYESPYFLTYKQGVAKGAKVRKGEKGTQLTYYKFQKMEDSNGVEKNVPLLKYFTVFNASQFDDLEYSKEVVEREFESIETCEKIIAEYASIPTIANDGTSIASYSPTKDLVNMPSKESFDSEEDYYCTLFHEISHSTGHKDRLKRDGITDKTTKEKYSKEELIAELGASFLCAVGGIDNSTIENSTAYIKGWLKVLKDDKKLIITSASKAKKSSDYILNTQYVPSVVNS